MTIIRLLIAGVLLVPIGGCDSAPKPVEFYNHAQKYGLSETTRFGEVMERAIILANVVLGKDEPIRLQPTWKPCGLYPHLEFIRSDRPGFRVLLDDRKDLCVYENARSVPVYLIDDDQLGKSENTFVPDGECCIFVNIRCLDRIFTYFGVSGQTQMSQYSEYERASVLATMLLHEVGHIHFGDSGSYTTPASLTSVDLSSKASQPINPEVRADRYAVEQIHKALLSDDLRPFLNLGSGRWSVASRLLFVINIAVNTYDYHNDPWGYLNNQPRLNLFASKGYSHLDINLRLLLMLYQLEPSSITKAKLKQLLGDKLDDTFAPPTPVRP